MIEQVIVKVSRLPRPAVYLLILLMILGIGAVDYFSGFELSFSIFYLLPIGLIAWITGRRDGVIAACLGAVVWFLADHKHIYSHPLFSYWNALVRLFFYLIVVYILTELRRTMERERALGRTDFLTGIPNSKAFYELAGRELEHCRREGLPVSIAYLDCDHFKAVNDAMGHQAGDELLRAVAQALVKNVRATDVAARIGGDEFVILLPQASAETARKVVDRVNQALAEEMKRNQWPVSFSFGVVTFAQPPDQLDQAICRADDLMYRAKAGGRSCMVQETA